MMAIKGDGWGGIAREIREIIGKQVVEKGPLYHIFSPYRVSLSC